MKYCHWRRPYIVFEPAPRPFRTLIIMWWIILWFQWFLSNHLSLYSDLPASPLIWPWLSVSHLDLGSHFFSGEDAFIICHVFHLLSHVPLGYLTENSLAQLSLYVHKGGLKPTMSIGVTCTGRFITLCDFLWKRKYDLIMSLHSRDTLISDRQ